MPTVSTGDITTYYEDIGVGEALVLVCGLSTDLQVWRFQSPELAKYYRVVCYDIRGRSNTPDEPYSIEHMTADLLALLDHLEIASAHVLGWSMGGQ